MLKMETIHFKIKNDGKVVEVQPLSDTENEVCKEALSDIENEVNKELENNEEQKKDEEVQNETIDYDTLCITGSSAKGLLILGSLQYAYDNFMFNNINIYIGTSSGAIISYLLAIGYKPIEIISYICTNQLLEKIQHFNIVAMLQGRGACSFTPIQEQIEKMSISKIGYLPTLKNIKDRYNKTLIFSTHNLTLNKTEYLSYETYPDLPCITALRMSANLPLVFEKYKYGNSYYIDGGISDNFPIEIADKMGSKIFGIILSLEEKNFNQNLDIDAIEYIYKLMFIPILQRMKNKIENASENCKIIQLSSGNSGSNFFDFNINTKQKLNMFSKGYQQMKEFF